MSIADYNGKKMTAKQAAAAEIHNVISANTDMNSAIDSGDMTAKQLEQYKEQYESYLVRIEKILGIKKDAKAKKR